jgi:hypothetical protein
MNGLQIFLSVIVLFSLANPSQERVSAGNVDKQQSARTDDENIPELSEVNTIEVGRLDGRWLKWLSSASEALKAQNVGMDERYFRCLEGEKFVAVYVTMPKELAAKDGSKKTPSDIIVYIDRKTSMVLQYNYVRRPPG